MVRDALLETSQTEAAYPAARRAATYWLAYFGLVTDAG